jgi:hypothetical protein
LIHSTAKYTPGSPLPLHSYLADNEILRGGGSSNGQSYQYGVPDGIYYLDVTDLGQVDWIVTIQPITYS